jgi:hypothetical protein
MELATECTHCRVAMSSWTAPGSTVRYWKCHLCRRTYSSLQHEAQPSDEEVRWSQLKRRAASWFERLEREGRTAPASPRRLSVEAVAAAAARSR